MPFTTKLDNRLKVARAVALRPDLSMLFMKQYLKSRTLQTSAAPPKIVIATHHKALTVYLRNVFRSFAILNNRSYSFGAGPKVDYDADVIFDNHSQLDFGMLPEPHFGLHVRRDPRDILVSASFYHQKSKEKWLQEPLDALDGKSYQEHINSLPDFESVLLFEMNWATGEVLRTMSQWNYSRPAFVEFEYGQLIGPDATDNFRQGLAQWRLPDSELDLLATLFGFFASDGPFSKGLKHIRNPASGQWKKHFTPRVEREFNEKYGSALRALGYETEDAEKPVTV